MGKSPEGGTIRGIIGPVSKLFERGSNDQKKAACQALSPVRLLLKTLVLYVVAVGAKAEIWPPMKQQTELGPGVRFCM